MAAADMGRGVLICMLAILEPRLKHVQIEADIHWILMLPCADAGQHVCWLLIAVLDWIELYGSLFLTCYCLYICTNMFSLIRKLQQDVWL